MKFILLLLYTFQGILSETVQVKNKCECKHIKTIEECNINCEWKDSKCYNSTLPLIRTSYCSYLTDKCNKTIGCANFKGICVPFAGCTAIKYNTNDECQHYSDICITDGQKCIEKSVCADYKTRFSCRNNYINYEWSGFCFWDKKECRNAQNCHELSFTLKNDAECRQQLSWCTFKKGGGCVDSAEQCKDQTFQQQCVTNRKGKKCYWDGLECNDYSCEYIKNDCIKNGCSINKDSQCMDRLECNQYTIEKSCTYNKSNIQCMWEDNVCRIKSCENASTKRQINEQCKQIDSICITKFGGGCKKNGECEEANTKPGCEQNIRGDTCYWNGYQCVIKQCQWAPTNLKDKKLCETFQSNCVLNGNICVEDGCYAQSNKQNCFGTKQCMWLDKCDIKTCESAGRNIKYITHQHCQNYLSTCTLNDSGIGCMIIKYSCNQYNREIQCYQSIQSKCTWYINQCVDSICEYKNYTTHQECNNYLNNCTTDGSKCIQWKSQCSQYTQEKSCNMNSQNHHCIWKNDKCSDITCDMIPKTYNFSTHQECNSYSSKCTILDRITGCIKMPSDCSLLNQDQCFGKKCIYSNGVCRNKQCRDYQGDVTQSNCQAFIEGTKCIRGPSLIPNSCVDQVKECLEITNEYQCEEVKDINNNKCRWDFSACIKWTEILIKKIDGNCPNSSISYDEHFCRKDKLCTDTGIATVDYTDEICENYLISCQKDTIKTCKIKSVSDTIECSYYLSKTNCIQQSNCYWSYDNKCIQLKNTCGDLLNKEDCQRNREVSGTFCSWDESKISCLIICETLTPKNQSCSSQDQQCVIQANKCVKKKLNCSEYAKSMEGCNDDHRCIYTLDNVCLEKQCSDKTDSLTHDECNSYKSECTIAYPGGCSDLLPYCTNYETENQCYINDKSKACYWSEFKGCVQQSCKEIVYDPKIGQSICQTFFTDLTCVINDKEDACEDLKNACIDYKLEKQCLRQLDGSDCMWKKYECLYAFCYNITLSEYSHQNCYQQYQNLKCTVNQTNDGCIDLRYDCTKYITQEQCYITTHNEDCVWNQSYSKCNFKTCKDEKPANQKCSDYLSSCIEPQYSCRNMICEDFEYNNNEECQQQDKKCTSNGRFCIQRGACEQNQYELACNIDINNRLCSWNSNKKQCDYVQCRDAPSSIIYSQDCEKYFPNQNCITKLGGGCLVVTGCFDYTIQAQCDESKLFDCIWQDSICRSKVCTDYKNSYILECQAKPLNCTTDGVTCIEMKNCAQLSKQTCTIGTDGICLFLDDRCQLYKNCQSIQFSSHQECYNILQNQCTSNGTQCIPISFCDEYNNKISCVKGIDGDCAWENSKCTLFSSCNNYHYKTHDECNSINQSCTTDKGIESKCIDLQKCTKYVEKNCKLDKSGIIKKDGLVTQLDLCIWKNQQCINITCEDLYGTDHLTCFKQLSTCTSDGIKCITIQKTCSSYLSANCDSAYSQEGKCANVNSQCSIIDCSTKTLESQCQALKHCQFINKSCQFYRLCQEYNIEKDCTIGTDGQCVFKNSKCILMKNCSDTNLKELCATKYCYWNENTSQCQPHKCDTYALQNSCGLFYNFQKTQITYCDFDEKSHSCKEINPTSFIPKDCFKKSLGYFSNINQTCQFCHNQSITHNNTNNNTNNTNNGTTPPPDNSSIIFSAVLIFVLLIII